MGGPPVGCGWRARGTRAPTGACVRSIDWERRHLGGAWEASVPYQADGRFIHGSAIPQIPSSSQNCAGVTTKLAGG